MKYAFDYSLFSLMSRRVMMIPQKLQLIKEIYLVGEDEVNDDVIDAVETAYDQHTNDIISLYTELSAIMLKASENQRIVIRSKSIAADFLKAMKTPIKFVDGLKISADDLINLKKVSDFKDDALSASDFESGDSSKEEDSI